MLKKVITFILVVTLFCSLSITSYATDTVDKTGSKPGTKMTYIWGYSYKLSISSSGLATTNAGLDAYPGVDKVRISMYLQCNDNGWSTVKHWAQNYTGTHGSTSKNWYVTKGYEYRILVYFYAYNGANVESISRIYDGVWY